jgi:putative transposase
MPYNPDIHHRRSIRLQGYDYAQLGAYFLTICTHRKQCIFGEIANGEMYPNFLGQVVISQWKAIPHHFPYVLLDEFVLMPNHFHGIIVINGTSPEENSSLAAIVRNFKSISARKINQINQSLGTPIWQRNYYEHIIRDEEALYNIREYILMNPSRWESDRENPSK